MPRYIVDFEKTKQLHNILQEMMFDHCEDIEEFPEDLDEAELHCLNCDYYWACRISNAITSKIALGEWDK